MNRLDEVCSTQSPGGYPAITACVGSIRTQVSPLVAHKNPMGPIQMQEGTLRADC